jgi:hypothetical protein
MYLTITRIAGDPDSLLPAYQRTSDVMAEVGRDHGLILHAATATDEGLLIVNVWPSQDNSEAAAGDPRRHAVVQHHGLTPDQLRYEHHELANCVVFGS